MTNYTITESEETITLTPKNNTKYEKTTYNPQIYHNNNTNNTIEIKRKGMWNLFSLQSLTEIIIPINTHFTDNTKISMIFTDPKGLTNTVYVPLTLYNFEDDIEKQFNPALTNNSGYMIGFIKTVLFDIYTDNTILKKITLYTPPAEEETNNNDDTGDDDTEDNGNGDSTENGSENEQTETTTENTETTNP